MCSFFVGWKQKSHSTRETTSSESIDIKVQGLVSKFAVGCGRTSTDRQFFYINGRPCSLNKVVKTTRAFSKLTERAIFTRSRKPSTRCIGLSTQRNHPSLLQTSLFPLVGLSPYLIHFILRADSRFLRHQCQPRQANNLPS